MSKSLAKKIDRRKAKIGIIGMGYVGLPLATAFAEAGFFVTGFEVDTRRAKMLNSGKSYIGDIPSKLLKGFVKSGKFRATTEFKLLRTCDAVIVCVPTPLRKTKDPDLSFIIAACGQIAQHLKRGQLIVLESTTYPGTTREMVQPALESGGLKAGKDFCLAFSPERVDPGNKNYGIKNTPKVVGGISKACGVLAVRLYETIVDKVVPVSSTETAEMVKLLENTFRAVNIGLINEMAMMCDRLGVDVWEIIEAAKTKPFGFMPFYPGPGLGGHCIPVDPGYLAWKMKELNFEPRFIDLASTINGRMPEYTVERIVAILNEVGKPLSRSNILVLGVAYKPGVSDTRESPSLDVIKLLLDFGAAVIYHDRFVPRIVVEGVKLRSRSLSVARIKRADLVVVLTAHDGVDYQRVLKLSRLYFDTRGVSRSFSKVTRCL